MELPEVIILSTQRSGTHFLQSLLEDYPAISGRGELFLRHVRGGEVGTNEKGKLNVGILMYTEIPIFLKFAEEEDNDLDVKIIHLIRNPHDVALSQLQMEADKRLHGKEYKAHYRTGEHKPESAGNVDLEKVTLLEAKISANQLRFRELLAESAHLEITYEELCESNKRAETIAPQAQVKLLDFLELPQVPYSLSTQYVKTGIKG